MKILVLSQYWHPENGVPQRRWTWLTGILQAGGHEVTVIAPPPHYKRSISLREWLKSGGISAASTTEDGANGEHVLRSGYFPSGRSLTKRIFNQAWAALSMISTVVRPSGPLSGYRPDIIIGTVPALPTAAVTLLAAKRFRTPYVIDLRDAWPALFKESGNWNSGTGAPSLRERILRHGPFQLLVSATEIMIETVLRSASGIVTTSSRLEAIVSEKHSAPTATVRNVFPSPYYRRGVGAERPQNSLNVLYAGTLGRAQKLENALLAAKIARQSGVEVSLRFIGDGAAWDALVQRADELDIDLRIEHQLTPEELGAHYEWADTALVHLADWDSLEVAVPSKTYELMSNRIHISGVVRGETADLIESLHAGDVIAPNEPYALAQLWGELSSDRSRLEVTDEGRRWVEQQRAQDAPSALLGLLQQVMRGHEGT